MICQIDVALSGYYNTLPGAMPNLEIYHNGLTMTICIKNIY